MIDTYEKALHKANKVLDLDNDLTTTDEEVVMCRRKKVPQRYDDSSVASVSSVSSVQISKCKSAKGGKFTGTVATSFNKFICTV